MWRDSLNNGRFPYFTGLDFAIGIDEGSLGGSELHETIGPDNPVYDLSNAMKWAHN